MASITIHIEAELELNAEQARDDAVNALESLLPYIFDNVIVTSEVKD